MKIEKLSQAGFEEIWHARDSKIHFNAFIAIHSTKRGPAIGGVRFRHYASETDALEEVKRLAESMTYKAAIADLDYGGGKGVMLVPAGDYDRPQLYERFAQFINHLKGRYISATDAGTTLEDVGILKQHSRWVGGAPQSAGGAGDPSPLTALGVAAGIKACVQEALQSSSLSGVRVILQGLGAVGSELARLLNEEGCELWGCDTNPRKLFTLSSDLAIHSILPEMALTQEGDVLCPCALGGVIDQQSIAQLQVRIVAGAANDQLSQPVADSKDLAERGILYAPDFVINAGGLIHIAEELSGYDPDRARRKVEAIGITLSELFAHSREQEITPYQAAMERATARLT